MTIPNPTYRYLWELVDRLRKRKTERDLEELHNIAHHLLTSSMEIAFETRQLTLIVGKLAREKNDLALYERLQKMDALAAQCESAVKAAGGYMKYEEKV